jgi:hypothetical protein
MHLDSDELQPTSFSMCMLKVVLQSVINNEFTRQVTNQGHKKYEISEEQDMNFISRYMVLINGNI